tara:strand:+ start:370 stop:501 length:132 start_codon:yes stop_codon:yes gene_type:complete
MVQKNKPQGKALKKYDPLREVAQALALRRNLLALLLVVAELPA